MNNISRADDTTFVVGGLHCDQRQCEENGCAFPECAKHTITCSDKVAGNALESVIKERDELKAHCMALSNDVEKGVEVMQRVLDSGVLTGEYDTLVHDHLVNYQFAKVPEYSLTAITNKAIYDALWQFEAETQNMALSNGWDTDSEAYFINQSLRAFADQYSEQPTDE